MDIAIKQGEDKVLNIPVTSDNNTAVDLTTATAILVVLSVNDQPVKNYEMGSTEAGAVGKLMLATGNNGMLQILVRKTHSSKFPLGILKANIAYIMPDNILGTKRTEVNITVGTVLAGATKDNV